MSRYTLATLMPVVGHCYKKFTSPKWARRYVRRGRGQIISGVLYCFRSGVTDPDGMARILPPRPIDVAQHNGVVLELKPKLSDGYVVVQGEPGNAYPYNLVGGKK